jgi:hypothetical protein
MMRRVLATAMLAFTTAAHAETYLACPNQDAMRGLIHLFGDAFRARRDHAAWSGSQARVESLGCIGVESPRHTPKSWPVYACPDQTTMKSLAYYLGAGETAALEDPTPGLNVKTMLETQVQMALDDAGCH